ncbi:CUB and sushi domain-containing protein 1 isoform X2 [Nematostella vectensis]|nr:CUB and sushi domain-containing protein 1 isoform X2 [Nematostella vectensis]
MNPPSTNTNIQLNASSGTIYSPDYTSQSLYPSDMECMWRITGPSGYIIRITFTVFELEEQIMCAEGDFLRVSEGQEPSSPVLGEFCGRKEPFSVQARGRLMALYFRTNNATEGRGFVASYRVIREDKGKDTESSTPVSLIAVGSVVAFVIVVGSVVAICTAKSNEKNRRVPRQPNSSASSHVSMCHSPSKSARPSRWGSPKVQPLAHLRTLSLPRLSVTNELGITTDLLPRNELRTQALVHTSPTSMRRYGLQNHKLGSPKSRRRQSPTLPKRQIGKGTVHVQKTDTSVLCETKRGDLGTSSLKRSF